MNIYLIVIVLFFSFNASASDVLEISSIDANELDSVLPSKPLDQWLLSVVGTGVRISSSEELSGCGENTGDSKQIDYPLCIEIQIIDKKETDYLYISVGTAKLGVSGKPTFFWGMVDGQSIRRLSELVSENAL